MLACGGGSILESCGLCITAANTCSAVRVNSVKEGEIMLFSLMLPTKTSRAISF
jgi:hypothetical protein